MCSSDLDCFVIHIRVYHIPRQKSLFHHTAKTCHLNGHLPLHTYKIMWNHEYKTNLVYRMNTNINNFKIYNKVLTFLQKACHLLGSASAIHMVSEQYPKPKHQIELFCLKKNETLILHGFKHMTTYILIAATNKNTFFWQIHAQFLYFTYVCNQKRKKKKKSTTKGRGVKTRRSFFFFF